MLDSIKQQGGEAEKHLLSAMENYHKSIYWLCYAISLKLLIIPKKLWHARCHIEFGQIQEGLTQHFS